jgi:hypothetical protein
MCYNSFPYILSQTKTPRYQIPRWDLRIELPHIYRAKFHHVRLRVTYRAKFHRANFLVLFFIALFLFVLKIIALFLFVPISTAPICFAIFFIGLFLFVLKFIALVLRVEFGDLSRYNSHVKTTVFPLEYTPR